MEERVVDAPASFVDDYQAVVDDLAVTEATYELSSVDIGEGGTGVARYSAAVQLEGIDDEWTWDGTLSIAEDDGDWLVEWAPSNIHPDLAEGQHLARTREVPDRAPILDAAGDPLSVGRPARVIGLEPRAVTDLNAIKAAFQQQLGIDPAAIDEALNAPGVQPDHFVTITTVDQARYDQVAAVIYPLPGTRFRDTFLRGGPDPRLRRPRDRRLRRDHRRAAGGARPSVPGGRPGGAERPRGPLRDPAGRHPVEHHPGRRRGRCGRGRGPPLRGRGAPSRCARRSTRPCSRRSRPPSATRRPPRPSSSSTRRATCEPSPPGRSASSTGRSPASTPPVRRSRSSPPPGCWARASRPTRRSSAPRRSTPEGARSATSSSRASAPSRSAWRSPSRATRPSSLRRPTCPTPTSWPQPRASGSTPSTRSASTRRAAASRLRPTPPSTRRPPSARVG